MSSELDRQGLVDIFVTEASQALELLKKAFHPADGIAPTLAQLQEQYVCAHKIRGASALYGYEGLALMGALLESTLEEAPSIEASLWPKALEAIRGMVASFESQLKVVAAGGAGTGRRTSGAGADGRDARWAGPTSGASRTRAGCRPSRWRRLPMPPA